MTIKGETITFNVNMKINKNYQRLEIAWHSIQSHIITCGTTFVDFSK